MKKQKKKRLNSYGNNRHMWAELKVRERRNDRAENKTKAMKEVRDERD